MEHSYAVSNETVCSVCQQAFTFDVWVIVDTEEKPELAQRIRQGTLHNVLCPHCNAELGVYVAPLLIFQPNAAVPLVYSQPKFSSSEEASRLLGGLLQTLQARTGVALPLDGSVQIVMLEYEQLPDFMNSGWNSLAHRSPNREEGTSIEHLRYLSLIKELMMLPTRRLTRSFLEQHPDLLDDLSLAILADMALAQQDAQVKSMIEHYRNLLGRCREAGIAKALDEDTMLFEEDELLEYFDSFPPEVVEVVSGLAKRGLELVPRPKSPSGRDVSDAQNKVATPDDATNNGAELSPSLREKVDRAFTIMEILRWSREPSIVNSIIDAWQLVLSDPETREHPILHGAAWTALGLACIDAYRDVGQKERVDLAIEACEEAIKLTDEGSLNWSSSMANLGLALHARYEAQGKSSDIEHAVEVLEQALTVTKKGDMDWEAMQSNLAMVLVRRYEGLGDVADLNEAIISVEKVLSINPQHDASHSMLGMALARRFDALNHKADIDASVEHFQKALEAVHGESNSWSKAQNNLAWSLTTRFDAYKDKQDLDKAVEAYDASIAITKENTPDWAIPMANSGIAQIRRFEITRNIEDLNKGISKLQKAIQTTVHGSPDWVAWTLSLGSAHYFKSQIDPEALPEAIAIYKEVLESVNPEEMPGLVCMTTRALGEIYLKLSFWSESADTYVIGVKALNTLYRSQLLQAGRESWLTKAGDIYRSAAYALAMAGRAIEAIVIMEQGRARGLSSALARDRANLLDVQKLDPKAYELYESATLRLRQFEALQRTTSSFVPAEVNLSNEDFYDQLRAAQTDLENAIKYIQRIPGYEDFLNEADYGDVTSAVAPDRPLVYLVTTLMGSLVLLSYISSDNVNDAGVALEVIKGTLTEAEIDRLILVQLYESLNSNLSGKIEEFDLLNRKLEESLWSVGHSLIAPLAARLQELKFNSLTLVPCGKLGLLPLHASYYHVEGKTRQLVDDFDIAYTPCARALNAARTELNTKQSMPDVLAGVGNPLPHPAPLSFAATELKQLTSFFKTGATHPLFGREATVESLLSVAPSAKYIHFACHGGFNPSDPLSSNVELSGDSLTLRQILYKNSQSLNRARLVVLSACQSAVLESRQIADEVISLSAGFLQIGVPGVVGSLWWVDDISTSLLMVKFYELMLQGDKTLGTLPMSPEHSLCQAQRWLRHATASDLTSIFKIERHKPDGERLMSYEQASDAWRRFNLMEPASCPFNHPIYWAAFSFTGI